MPVMMSAQKKPFKNKQLKAELTKEFNFLKKMFSVSSIPLQAKGDNEDNLDYEIVNGNVKQNEEKELPIRARSIVELEEKLEKMKSLNKFNLKSKLEKKSLNSKLNKKIRKKERLNKVRIKPLGNRSLGQNNQTNEKVNANVAKPVFNNDGKLVFSKFDFANIGGKEKVHKKKDPKKILENLNEQEEKLRQLSDKDESKVKELKEKVAWKNILQKAEGHKVKDDPVLLKKSIKKMEQKKRRSKKQWDDRVKKVEEKKEEKQKKRKENITNKKKEKKSKIVKAAVKRGRVVI